MTRTRQLVGLLTLLALMVIVLGVTGVQLPLPGAGADQPVLPGVKARAASTLVRAPVGGELAYLTVEPDGNLFVSDSKRASVLRFDPSGQQLSEWGPQFGSVQLVEPAGVAVAGDSYYVLDRGMARIFRLDNTGQLQAAFSLQQYGPYGLNGLAVDAAGNLYAADTGRNRILEFSPTGQLVKQIGHAGSDVGGFTQPYMLAFGPDGGLFVTDWENKRIEHFDASMNATDAWSTGFGAFGIAVDPMGRIFAPDFDRKRIEVYTPQGASLGEIGGPDAPIVAMAPKQVALAPTAQPSLYVLGSDQIQRLDLDNTSPPPQSSGSPDMLSVLAIVLMLAVVALAVLSRRERRQRQTASVGGGVTLERPVGLHAEDSAQRQQQQPRADEDLLIAHQAERKE
jgi:DNA-binding beta-propeller fold protein YncE